MCLFRSWKWFVAAVCRARFWRCTTCSLKMQACIVVLLTTMFVHWPRMTPRSMCSSDHELAPSSHPTDRHKTDCLTLHSSVSSPVRRLTAATNQYCCIARVYQTEPKTAFVGIMPFMQEIGWFLCFVYFYFLIILYFFIINTLMPAHWKMACRI